MLIWKLKKRQQTAKMRRVNIFIPNISGDIRINIFYQNKYFHSNYFQGLSEAGGWAAEQLAGPFRGADEEAGREAEQADRGDGGGLWVPGQVPADQHQGVRKVSKVNIKSSKIWTFCFPAVFSINQLEKLEAAKVA